MAARKGGLAARAREGAAYAYGAERRLRERLGRLRPVGLALEAAGRWARGAGRERALAGAVRVGPQSFPAVWRLVAESAERLGVPVPETFVTAEAARPEPLVLGGVESPVLLIPGRLVDGLSEAELRAAVGGACGRIQNDHVELLTALWALQTADTLVARWASAPAMLALRGWAARSIVTADRAALVCSRDVGGTVGMIVKAALGERRLLADVDVDATVRAIDAAEQSGTPVSDEIALTRVGARVRALRVFHRTAYARGVFGQESQPGEPPALSIEACDVETTRILGEQAR